ncbi:MAG TPA: 2-dehydropantoate 2-reductase N-terminal domain-containing protein [Candidatus Acidoferrales bacterium]|nr:2-dehydropantoate 2-reductase N-terminal domain-containing protein [Candidatus Acidoferrales bacterium]
MRYVVYGAGAVGGTIGAKLFEAGNDVTLVARGEHGRAIAERGLAFATPEGTRVLRIPVVDRPASVAFGEDSVVVLAVKSQDTAVALRDLAACAPEGLPVMCAQNGVENERSALRHFANVHGMCVQLPAAYLEAGEVRAYASPTTGALDVGRYPRGIDEIDRAVAADLRAASFAAEAVEAVMDRKYAKLLANLRNAILAIAGHEVSRSSLYDRAQAEATACFAAAGITVDDAAGRKSPGEKPVGGALRGGGSSWQSLARGAESVETDFLNGEIVLLGRLHGVPTPVNAMLQRVANRSARERMKPETLSLADLEREL